MDGFYQIVKNHTKLRKASQYNMICFSFAIEPNFAVTPTVIKLPLTKEIKSIFPF